MLAKWLYLVVGSLAAVLPRSPADCEALQKAEKTVAMDLRRLVQGQTSSGVSLPGLAKFGVADRTCRDTESTGMVDQFETSSSAGTRVDKNGLDRVDEPEFGAVWYNVKAFAQRRQSKLNLANFEFVDCKAKTHRRGTRQCPVIRYIYRHE